MSADCLKVLRRSSKGKETVPDTEHTRRMKILRAMKIPLTNQSVEVKPGVRTSILNPDGKHALSFLYEDATTLYETFLRGQRVSDNGPCLGTRSGPNLEYEWLSYNQVIEASHEFGSGLIKEGMLPGQETFVGIFASNRPEWVMTEQSCNMYSMITVPIYETLGDVGIRHIISHTGMRVVVCDTVEKARSLLQLHAELPELKLVIVMDLKEGETVAEGEGTGVKIMTFRQVQMVGKNNLVEAVPPEPDFIAQLGFTSGTTGMPKGVIQTHKMMVGMSSAVCVISMTGGVEVTPQDVNISYLPLAHVFERLVQVCMFMHGAQVGFWRGNPALLIEDIMALKPTWFPAVPRILQRIYDKVMMGVNAVPEKKAAFEGAMAKKKEQLSQGIIKDPATDKAFATIQGMLGGKLRVVVTGGAPIATHVLDFVRCTFGCEVYEAYGQTEITGAITMTVPGEFKSGHVGAPIPSTLVKLIDVPEMEIEFLKHGRGEICAKGYCVMPGYYKDEGKTKEALDEEGWLHTGDIGEFQENGTLRIVDRVKHIFKLAQGDYIAPERIENILTESSVVAQAFVDGKSLERFPVGIIVPDPEVLPGWAEKRGVTGSMQELCQNQEINKAILEELTTIGKEAGLKGFELVHHIHLNPEQFTCPELLTPTLKNKRAQLRTHFAAVIDGMYAQTPTQNGE